jgi:2,3-bisphosphoglycerate-dependent phosphoglycerate mutase
VRDRPVGRDTVGVQPPPEGFRQARFVPPPGSTTVLLVRHGESAPAHPDRPFPLVDGHGDPELAPEGRRQAEAVGRRLAAEHHGGATIDGLYVTTLRRTHETAAPLADAIGLDPVVVGDLREVHLGDWEGGSLRMRAAARDPVFLQVLAEERWDVIPGAEPFEDFDRRLRQGIDAIVERHPDGRAVAVVHGGVIGHLLALAARSVGFSFAGADNASISELVVLPDRSWRIRRFNDTAHLVAVHD